MRSTDTSTACDDLSRRSGILPSRHSSSANLLLGAVLWSERDNDRRLGIEQAEEFADRRKGEWLSLRGGCYCGTSMRGHLRRRQMLQTTLWQVSPQGVLCPRCGDCPTKHPSGGIGVLTFGKRRIV